MKRNSKRMSRKSMRGGTSCNTLRKSKRSMRGGKCSRKKSMSGGNSDIYMGPAILKAK